MRRSGDRDGRGARITTDSSVISASVASSHEGSAGHQSFMRATRSSGPISMAGPSKVPDNLRYTEDHERVLVEGNRAKVGITDYAQEALTDVVYVELPDSDEEFNHHDSLGVVESVK